MNDDATFVSRWARRRRIATPLIVALAAAALVAWLVTSVARADIADESRTLSGTVAVIASVVVVVAVLVAWRAARIRVVITRTEVVLHNIVGSRHIPFAEIAGFEIARRNQLAWPRTLLRLTAWPHGIPRSIAVAAASPATGLDDWLTVGWWVSSMGRRADATGQLAPTGDARPIGRALAELVAAMNAELDGRRGIGHSTTDLLQAAHPAFRRNLFND